MSSDLVKPIAGTILEGFNNHFSLFLEITEKARERFESSDWNGEIHARKERIDYYDMRVGETVDILKEKFDFEKLDKKLWQEIKRWFMWLLYEHKQPELAESFYNSVFCRLFDRSYYNNSHIFVKPSQAVDYLDMDDPAYNSYYPDEVGLEQSIKDILQSFELSRSWQDIQRDIELLSVELTPCFKYETTPPPMRQLNVVGTLFYRNKAAYIVGRLMIGPDIQGFVIPILINEQSELYVDTLITDANDLALIFSFTRAYFMVKTKVPSGLVEFLSSILPSKTRADIYTSIGFQKQGKTMFYREFLYHLEHSHDKFVIAPGIKGMVMAVFTLPSYPYVFKVIKDHFAPPKQIDRKTVKEKYQMVKMHDRVGRMADTLEFSHVAFPVHRFTDDLLDELKNIIPSSLSIEDGSVIIRHLYIERRMVPFNLYIDHADEEQLNSAIRGYGNAIKEMIAANIFPGDMLLKNFGVTRQNRVIFYDYDEICHMNEIKIRRTPVPRTPEQEMASEPWYHIGEEDFFPEQFEHFVINHPKVRKKFLHYHAELLEPEFWKQIQNDLKENKRHNVFPYKQDQRFCNRFPEKYPQR